MQQVRDAFAARNEQLASKAPSVTSTSSRPRWLRKVTAWLEGRWGIGHRRKES